MTYTTAGDSANGLRVKPASALLALCFALLPGAAIAADGGAAIPASPEDIARRAKIAIRVGESTVTVGELEDRLAGIPPYQIRTYGPTRAELVQAYVDQVVVHDLVLGEGARMKGLSKEPLTHQRLLRAHSDATLRALHHEVGSPMTVPAADVAAYYAANLARFDAPERINVWRILCATADEARSVIATAKADLTIPKYQDLARDHSIDKATKYRGGNLGFLAPDGTSNEAGLKVDPMLVKAASTLKDGAVSAEPVPEGNGFAVLWRRMTVPPGHKSLEEAEGQIRTTLFRERSEGAEKRLIEELRTKYVRDYDAEPLKVIEFPALDAGLSLPRSVPAPRR